MVGGLILQKAWPERALMPAEYIVTLHTEKKAQKIEAATISRVLTRVEK